MLEPLNLPEESVYREVSFDLGNMAKAGYNVTHAIIVADKLVISYTTEECGPMFDAAMMKRMDDQLGRATAEDILNNAHDLITRQTFCQLLIKK